MVSACKRAGARSVTAVVPYYGYARSDRRFSGDAEAISAGDVTQILEFMGVDRIVAVDLHSSQISAMGTPKMVFDNYNAGFTSIRYFLEHLTPEEKDNLTVVSPDAGGMSRAKAFH